MGRERPVKDEMGDRRVCVCVCAPAINWIYLEL